MTAAKPKLDLAADPLRFDNRRVAPEGCRVACLYLVGAPGKKEAEAGRPFVGPAGEALREHDAGSPYRRLTRRLANAIAFRPIEWKARVLLRNRTPTQAELHAYGQSVLSDVLQVKPAVICVLKLAASLFGIPGQIYKLRKRSFAFRGIPVRVTYHPSYVLRFGGKGSWLWKSTVRDLQGYWLEAQGRDLERHRTDRGT